MDNQNPIIEGEILSERPYSPGGALAPLSTPTPLTLREVAEQAYLALPPDSQTRQNYLKLFEDANRGDTKSLLEKVQKIEGTLGISIFAPQTTHNTVVFIDNSDRSVHHHNDNRRYRTEAKEGDPDYWMPAAVCVVILVGLIAANT